jgi:hypothetical protein
VTLTTGRANPLCRWNPGWGGRSTARRPAAAVNKVFPRRSVFVKILSRPQLPEAGIIRRLGLLADPRVIMPMTGYVEAQGGRRRLPDVGPPARDWWPVPCQPHTLKERP